MHSRQALRHFLILYGRSIILSLLKNSLFLLAVFVLFVKFVELLIGFKIVFLLIVVVIIVALIGSYLGIEAVVYLVSAVTQRLSSSDI